MSAKTAVMRPLRAQSSSVRSLLQPTSRALTATSSSASLSGRRLEQRISAHPTTNREFLPTKRSEFYQSQVGDTRHFPHQGSQPWRRSASQKAPFSDLLNAITNSLTTTNQTSLPYLHTLLKSYTSNPDDWSRYAHANPSKRYTRNLVFGVPGVFNLLLLVWTPGQKSPVHDHADAHCLMKVLKGAIRETRFATPEHPGKQGPLIQTACRTFCVDKVAYMADELGLHSIANPHPTEYAVSLHLYTPPNAATRGCNIFDEENGEAQHVSQCTYDSIEGVPVEHQ